MSYIKSRTTPIAGILILIHVSKHCSWFAFINILPGKIYVLLTPIGSSNNSLVVYQCVVGCVGPVYNTYDLSEPSKYASKYIIYPCKIAVLLITCLKFQSTSIKSFKLHVSKLKVSFYAVSVSTLSIVIVSITGC